MTQLEKREAAWLDLASKLNLRGIVIFTGDALQLQSDKRLLESAVRKTAEGVLNYQGTYAEEIHWSILTPWANAVHTASKNTDTTAVVTQRLDVIQALAECSPEDAELRLFRIKVRPGTSSLMVDAYIARDALGKMLQRDMEVR